MMKTIPHPNYPKRFFLKQVLLVLLLTAVSFAQNNSSPAPNTETTQMWAAGDDKGVYLAVAKKRDDRLGFQIYFRGQTSDQFIPGSWYAGQPLAVVLRDQRLRVFLDGGGCQSYDLHSGQTERRLPAGLIPVSCTSSAGRLLVLAKTTQPVHIEAIKFVESGSTPHAGLDLDQDAWTLLILGSDHHWKSYGDSPLPLSHWSKPTIAAVNAQIHLFGITRTDSPQESGQIIHAQMIDHRLTDPQPIPFDHPLAVTPLIVNKQLRLIIQTLATTDSTTPSPTSSPGQLRQSVLAWQNNNHWTFSLPLLRQAQETLMTGPDNLCLTNMDQMIVAFERPDPRQIFYGFYRTDGSTEQPLTQPLQLLNRDLQQWTFWLTGPKAEMTVLLIVLALLYVKRQDAFFDSCPVPTSFEPAPYWRRGGAWLLDFFPITLAGWLLLIPFYPELKTLTIDQDFFLAPPQNYHDLLTYEAMTILFLITTALFVIYQILCESFLGASPGKKALRLHVIDYQGHSPKFRQIFLRNIFRLLETLPMIILLLLLFTRRRQRIGDLMGQTIIVTETNRPTAKPPHPSSASNEHDPQTPGPHS